MIYLTIDDLTTDSYQQFIDESSEEGQTTLDKAEKRAIAYAQSLLQDKYDVSLIFAEGNALRDEILVDILSKITLFYLFKRNAARKIGSTTKEDYDWAIKQLEKIHTGRISLNLPAKTDGNGNSVSTSLYGNNTNTDFYI